MVRKNETFLYVMLAVIYISAIISILRAVPQRLTLDPTSRVQLPGDTSVGQLPGDLPQVKVDYGKYRPNVGDGSGDGDSGEKIADIRRQCLNNGYRLGDTDVWQDCEVVCSSADVDYRFFDDNDGTNGGVYVGRLQVRKGAYCVPTAAAQCNTRTSLLLYAYNGWTCIPQISGFTGEGGNTISMCDGRIWDRGTGTVYDKYIPSNLVFQSFYNDKLSDGTYRFACPNQIRDRNGNFFLASPLNRVQLIDNFCISNIPYAQYQQVEWRNSSCNCEIESEGKWGTDEKTQKCIACRNYVDKDTLVTYFSPRNCYNTTDSYETVKQLLTEDRFAKPCGVSVTDTMEGTRPRCTSAGIAAFEYAMASPLALRNRYPS